MSWLAGPRLGFDTETTGLDVTSDRIVTAALVLRGPRGSHVRTWLIDPGVEIPVEAASIHGITTAHARSRGAPARTALEEIASSLTAHVAVGVPVVAFNAAFDLSLLDAELSRHGLATLPERLGGVVRPVLDPLVLDRAADRLRTGGRRLTDLCAHYDVLEPGALHTADVDALATLDVLDVLVHRHPHLALRTLDELHDWQAGVYRRWADEVVAARQGHGPDGAGAEPARWPSD